MFDQVPDGPERVLNTYRVTVCNEGIGGISGPIILWIWVNGFPKSAARTEFV